MKKTFFQQPQDEPPGAVSFCVGLFKPLLWTVEQSRYKVIGGSGEVLPYCYARDERDAGAAGVLTWDEARRIATSLKQT